ncbi:MAG: TATA-box-binding protein [Promethearchaeota archaeon]
MYVDEEVTVKIQNVVASVDLFFKINLEKAARVLASQAEISYIPEQFPGLVVKIRAPYPKTSALVFSSGKMVITGAKSAQAIDQAVTVLRDLLGKSSEKSPAITVQNIVASGNIGYRINLELAALLLENCMYEPEQFPGLIYRINEPKTVLLLFQSGNVVCTGAKKEEFAYEAVKKVREDLVNIDAIMSDTEDIGLSF